MRKAKLLSTVAAALLLSAGVASAQGMSKDTPERAPAAQQNAPAEKVAPSIKGGEHKAPQTTGQAAPGKSDMAPLKSGQAAPDAKSGKARETTGQAPKSDDKAQAPSRSMDKSDVRTRSEQNQQSPGGASKSTQSTTDQNRTTTGQGAAAGSANLSTEQRTKITTIIRQHKVEPARLNVSVSVGTRIPSSVRFYPLPIEVIAVYPEWRGYDYILVGDQILIINPRTHEIVAIIEA